MIDFDIPKNQSSIIKVIGVGGGGSNAVNYMFSQNVEGVDFVICNTDAKALELSKIANKVQLGPHLTQGLGAGANPDVGKKATEESLEEIKRILEVNTKMAFVCAGMGGGTGTGGAPIIARICQELGILTVGIVTTPFNFEGPKRRAQAEAGIKELEPYVDTLLVISNDKMKMLHANLKMMEAFSKADDILATAAKCITDIINSKGHIIVDFADVCTVMKNGGVAILGSAQAEGENRAQRAVEQALSSPLLNDNDIKGAKWILLNVVTGVGEYECGMDEFELINDIVRANAGKDTDVILGLGIDENLGKNLSVTLIATGFENKSPFEKQEVPQIQKIENVVLDLKEEDVLNPSSVASFLPKELKTDAPPTEEKINSAGERLVAEEQPCQPNNFVLDLPEETPSIELSVPITDQSPSLQENVSSKEASEDIHKTIEHSFLAKPTNIYVATTQNQLEKNEHKTKGDVVKVEQDGVLFEYHENGLPEQEITGSSAATKAPVGLDGDLTEEEIQRRRAEMRLQKLRNLSFDVHANDPYADLENVPSYLRKKLESLRQNKSAPEMFYSSINVEKTEDNQINLSSRNSFLEGEKPD